ncbi:MAG: Trk family potassium uptake protein [Chloroflexi bacterium]|nr:Trk family potassium uptake protein [Chloroflexota bacterium]
MIQSWKRRPGDRVIRHPRQEALQPVYIPAPPRRRPARKFESPLVLVYGFGGLIAVGTTLLWLPFFNTTGDFAPFMTALFTATSAVCVTGLYVVNTGTYWNDAGQAVIMVLILIGGLGFMSTATFLLLAVAQRISLPDQFLIRRFLDVNELGGFLAVAIQVVAIAFVIMSIGFVVIFWQLAPVFGTGEGARQALFTSISAYNNAGFDILPGSISLATFSGKPWLLGGIAGLVMLGSTGYAFMVDAWRAKRFNRFALDTKLILVTTIPLWIVGALFFLVFEYANGDTLGFQSVADKGMNAFFHSVMARTAGFSSVNLGAAQLQTIVLLIGLMFIGGASGSTAGGIKVNTVAVILATVCASIRNRNNVEAFRKEIPTVQVHRALTVAFLGVIFIAGVSFLLVMTEGFPFEHILFQVVSAFGTVGLSTGITADLSTIGKTLIILTMFVGRLGPLTIALALGQGQRRAVYRYSQERVKIG